MWPLNVETVHMPAVIVQGSLHAVRAMFEAQAVSWGSRLTGTWLMTFWGANGKEGQVEHLLDFLLQAAVHYQSRQSVLANWPTLL
jgi:hypothetical protein